MNKINSEWMCCYQKSLVEVGSPKKFNKAESTFFEQKPFKNCKKDVYTKSIYHTGIKSHILDPDRLIKIITYVISLTQTR